MRLVFKAIWNCVKEFLILLTILVAGIVGLLGVSWVFVFLCDKVVEFLTWIFGEGVIDAAGQWLVDVIPWACGGVMAIGIIAMVVIQVKTEYDILKGKEERLNAGPDETV